jgi:hypothetical protein
MHKQLISIKYKSNKLAEGIPRAVSVLDKHMHIIIISEYFDLAYLHSPNPQAKLVHTRSTHKILSDKAY